MSPAAGAAAPAPAAGAGLVRQVLRSLLRGDPAYFTWMAFLAALVAWGAGPYLEQLERGLIVNNLRDPLPWGLHIGNFTFLVGVAAASVTVVVPARVYGWRPLHDVVIFSELLAVSAVVMSILFVTVDIGRPERAWHMLPGVGRLHLPASPLAWDVVVLSAYLVLNLAIVGYLLGCGLRGRPHDARLTGALVGLSVSLAIVMHTVTAFLYCGLAARPYWHSAIVAPRFLASAFCSGLAVLVVVFQVVHRTTRLRVEERALWKMSELLAWACGVNLFLQGVQLLTEVWGGTRDLVHTRHLWLGPSPLQPYVWIGLAANGLAFLLLLVPWTRRRFLTLHVACLLVFWGIYVEKAAAFVAAGLTPTPLGEAYAYAPNLHELRVAAGIFALGLGLFTALCKVAVPIQTGELRLASARPPLPAS